jgi:hypothetical protein
MKRNRKRIVAAVAVVGALAAGGAAFTYSNTMPSDTVAGYSNIKVSGADVVGIHNTLSTDGQTINQVHMDFSPAIDPAATVEIGWSSSVGTAPDPLSSQGCLVSTDGYSVTCTGLSQPVGSANNFAVAVYK